MQIVKEQIFRIYNDLNIGNCDICKKCKTANKDKLHYPVSLWTIGENFQNSNDKILFVGKTARGGEEDLGPLINNSFIDATGFGKQALRANPWPYFSYTNEIIKRYFGTFEEGKKNIAFTNLVKCNSGSTQDNTISETKVNCLDKLGVVWKEIEILRPKRIVFYSHNAYDDFIEKMRPSFSLCFIDIKDKKHVIRIGNKYSYWWHRDFLGLDGQVLLSFLRISHPERKQKADYVRNVVQWLKETKK